MVSSVFTELFHSPTCKIPELNANCTLEIPEISQSQLTPQRPLIIKNERLPTQEAKLIFYNQGPSKLSISMTSLLILRHSNNLLWWRYFNTRFPKRFIDSQIQLAGGNNNQLHITNMTA